MIIRRRLPLLWLALALAPVAAQAQNIATVAGGGPNNLAPLSSSVGIPVGIAEDSNGNLYFADPHSNRVYEVSTGAVLTVFRGMAERDIPVTELPQSRHHSTGQRAYSWIR